LEKLTMRLSPSQKFLALLGAFKARKQLKQTLIRNYWATKKTFPLNLPGFDITFCTDDYYSVAWFYQQSQVENYIYEPAITHIMVERLRSARCFADVGANLGYFTTIAAKVRPDIPVYGFELDGTLLPIVDRNLRLNHVENATVVNAAVGDGNGSFQFTPHPYSFLSMVSQIATEPFEIQLSTPILRLDDYFQDQPIKPDFMKVDIDGGEMAMLRGAEKLLAQDDLEMLLEVHTSLLPPLGSSTGEVLEFLRQRRFRSYQVGGFRESDERTMVEVTDRPEALQSETGDMLYVTRDPSRFISKQSPGRSAGKPH
jgi:FkbM family methyltransferase